MMLMEAGENLPPDHPKKSIRLIPKGCCKYCGKRIGKGIYFHEKTCKVAK